MPKLFGWPGQKIESGRHRPSPDHQFGQDVSVCNLRILFEHAHTNMSVALRFFGSLGHGRSRAGSSKAPFEGAAFVLRGECSSLVAAARSAPQMTETRDPYGCLLYPTRANERLLRRY